MIQGPRNPVRSAGTALTTIQVMGDECNSLALDLGKQSLFSSVVAIEPAPCSTIFTRVTRDKTGFLTFRVCRCVWEVDKVLPPIQPVRIQTLKIVDEVRIAVSLEQVVLVLLSRSYKA